ncbi:2,3-diphosphoglycerate-dependent phosphoglycerate mutase [Buchnera aphidicola (Thelaxes californica)]|uniref:2,3-bisphosphoglycerate-dependent phosphoglycerate mutase n=1 Tax=Buchnera aphidicola (Thelaxes californica) TaxID=1315998 RepID=A0A4D6YAE0_9GAMM|nr:2,3-diphosphoglycerate-dependent phosphoglycerate mutase [Buchnera aphidicola]QCI26767.1 2,3-diphosphoglycerate-dependent phosphoglycerate mutase [Buchnera aphidicola (Thelaxes californica)]
MSHQNLILIRHGESLWNQKNQFTGWRDIDLSQKGEQEALQAAMLLKKHNFKFDCSYTSVLKRAIHSLWIILKNIQHSWIPVKKDWKLNERHYGILEGLNKKAVELKYGTEQMHQWRRSFTICPPKISETNVFFPGNDCRYNNIPKSLIPTSESLKDTMKRVVTYWNTTILPEIKKDKKILIVAHGNSLRSLIKYLANINDNEIEKIELNTGVPIVYEFDSTYQPKKYYTL